MPRSVRVVYMRDVAHIRDGGPRPWYCQATAMIGVDVREDVHRHAQRGKRATNEDQQANHD